MCTSLALCLLGVSEILPGWADLIWNGFIRGVVRFEITLASFNTRLYFPANGLEILRFRDLLGCKIKQWTRFLISSRKIFLRNVFQFEVNGTVWNTIDALAMYIDSMVIQRIELILDSCRNIWNWGNVKHWIWNTQTHFFLPMLNQTRGEIGTYDLPISSRTLYQLRLSYRGTWDLNGAEWRFSQIPIFHTRFVRFFG